MLTHLAMSSASGRWLCLLFANTVENYRLAEPLDDLADFASWVQWSLRHGVIGDKQAASLLKWSESRGKAALAEAQAFRLELFRLLSGRAAGRVPDAESLKFLNDRLPGALGNLRIEPASDGLSWRLQAVDTAPALLWPIVLSAAELLTSRPCEQLRQCGGDKCTWLFIDQSKNQSRRWCDMKVCGNRAKSRRHYLKQRSPAA